MDQCSLTRSSRAVRRPAQPNGDGGPRAAHPAMGTGQVDPDMVTVVVDLDFANRAAVAAIDSPEVVTAGGTLSCELLHSSMEAARTDAEYPIWGRRLGEADVELGWLGRLTEREREGNWASVDGKNWAQPGGEK